jgi:hypothetical protein
MTLARARSLIALGLLVLACDSSGSDAANLELPDLPARGAVVARVDGAELGLDDVGELMRDTGLPARTALDRLIAEQLLGRHAAAQGHAASPELSRELRKARARALLEATVEKEVAEASIPEADVRARFARDKNRYDQRETRELVYVSWAIAPGTPEAIPRGLAQQALDRLLALSLSEVTDELHTIANEARAQGVAVKEGAIQVVEGEARVDPNVAAAVFPQHEPALVPEVLKAGPNFSVVYISNVIRAHEAAFEEHAAEVRAQLLSEARHKRAQTFIDELRHRVAVVYHEDIIERALSDEALLGTLP